jgi:cytochrome P450
MAIIHRDFAGKITIPRPAATIFIGIVAAHSILMAIGSKALFRLILVLVSLIILILKSVTFAMCAAFGVFVLIICRQIFLNSGQNAPLRQTLKKSYYSAIEKFIVFYYDVKHVTDGSICKNNSERLKERIESNNSDKRIAERVDNDRAHVGNMYYVYDGSQKIVVIGGYEAAKEFYRAKEYKHIKRTYPYLGYVFDALLKYSIGAHTGEEWLSMKKPLMVFFTTKSVHDNYDMIVDATHNWLTDVFNSHHHSYKLQNLELDTLTLNIMANIVYGPLSKEDLKELHELSLLHNKLMMIMGRKMSLREKIVHNNVAIEERKYIEEFTERWSIFNDARKKCIVSNTLLNTMIEHSVYKNNTLMMNHTLYEIALFNLDIMIDSFANLIWNIASNPEVNKRLYKECRNVDYADYRQIEGCRYLTCVINESARLNPGIVMTFAETIDSPMIINGYNLPSGSMVSLDTQMINRDPTVWNDPHEFKPERFTDENTIENTIENTMHMYHRFGLGPRKCLGNVFGDYILKIGVIALMKEFNMSVESNTLELIRDKRETIPNLANYNMTNNIEFTRR